MASSQQLTITVVGLECVDAAAGIYGGCVGLADAENVHINSSVFTGCRVDPTLRVTPTRQLSDLLLPMRGGGAVGTLLTR